MVKSDNNSNKSLKDTYLCLYAMVLVPDLHYEQFPIHPGPSADPCKELYSIIFNYLYFHAKTLIMPFSLLSILSCPVPSPAAADSSDESPLPVFISC